MNDPLRPFDTDHVKHSIGGFTGHALRRATHMVMALIPLIFYARGVEISDYLGMNPDQLVSSIIITLIIIEALRIKMGIVIIGQREYEAKQISALAWGGFAVALALLIAPDNGKTGLESGLYGIPLIFGLTFVDPIMGEIRKKQDLKLAILGRNVNLICRMDRVSLLDWNAIGYFTTSGPSNGFRRSTFVEVYR